MDKEFLLNPDKRDKPALKTEKIEIEGAGIIVVRALTRAEGHRAAHPDRKGRKPGPDVVEYRTVQMGMVDPMLTYEEVEQWAGFTQAGEIQKVVAAIMTLSGWGDDEEENPVKTAYKSTED